MIESVAWVWITSANCLQQTRINILKVPLFLGGSLAQINGDRHLIQRYKQSSLSVELIVQRLSISNQSRSPAQQTEKRKPRSINNSLLSKPQLEHNMAQALDAGNYVYEGIWTNWSRGPIAGLTLTVNASRASVLSPAIAILVSVAGIQLWRLIQFALHQIRVTTEPRPMIYHQLQITLRNTMTDISTLWRLIRIGISWREWRPVLGLAIWTLIHFVLVLGFGLLSSWLLLSTDVVLSRSPWCGTSNRTYMRTVYSTNISDPEHSRLVAEFNQYTYSRFANIRQHVDLCSNVRTSCNINPTTGSGLPWKSNYVADVCPFNSSICHSDAGTMFLDTGHLSSHDQLALNAKPSDRVSVRMLARCSPLNNINYTTPWTTDLTSASTLETADAMYGRSTYNTRNATNTLFRRSYTCEQRYNMAPYSLTSYMTVPKGSIKTGTSTFDPIPELSLTDGDISLMTLGYNDAYIGLVLDPWFYADQPIVGPPEYCARSNKTLYIRERPLSALACVQQWQICNKSSTSTEADSCTPLLGITQLQALLLSPRLGLDLNPVQKATAIRILISGSRASFFYLVLALSKSSSPPLRAQYFVNTVGTAISTALPKDQWQKETEYWMDLILAYFQQDLLDGSSGQFVARTDYINATQQSPNKADLLQNAAYSVCQNQMIRSTSYRNFNFPALVLIITFCTAFIVIGLVLEDCVGCCRERRHRYSGPAGKGRQDMWNANADLFMLRTIDETKHGTTWGISSNGIPRTGPGYEVALKELLLTTRSVDERRVRYVDEVEQPETKKNETQLDAFELYNQYSGNSTDPHSQQDWKAFDGQTRRLSFDVRDVDLEQTATLSEAGDIPLTGRLRRQPCFAFSTTSDDASVRRQHDLVIEMEDWPWLSRYSRLQEERGRDNWL